MTRRLASPLLLVSLISMTVVACGDGPGSADPPAPPDSPTSVDAEPWFEEMAEEIGIDFHHRSGAAGELLFPEIMSGGAALFDADGDGDLDVFLIQGIFGPGEAPGELWRNDGGRFARVDDWLPQVEADGAGNSYGAASYGMGAAAGDADGDGDVDLFVAAAGRDRLLLNETPTGDPAAPLHFRDATAAAGLAASEGDAWSSSAGFFDADGDGDLDLFVTRYVRWSPESDLDCASPSGGADYCSPLSYSSPLPDLLYRNEGTSEHEVRFRQASAEAGLRKSFGNGLGLAFLDLDLDQDLDVFVANDQTPDQLWRNLGDGTFEDAAAELGTAVGPAGEARAGMGVATGDLDDDGDIDVLVVNLERQADTLLRNEGAFFRDVTAASGLGTVGRSRTRFGAGFADFDHDGHLDLYVANGRVTLPAGQAVGGDVDPFAESNLLLAGDAEGRFTMVEPAGGTDPVLLATSRAAAFGDLDGDGDLDVVVVNRDGPVHVLRNLHADRRSGHWLLIDLRNSPGRSALGAEVRVRLGERTLHRFVAPASSYQSSHDPRVHVGLGELGNAVAVHVEVRWPDGTVQDAGALAVDRLHVIEQQDP